VLLKICFTFKTQIEESALLTLKIVSCLKRVVTKYRPEYFSHLEVFVLHPILQPLILKWFIWF